MIFSRIAVSCTTDAAGYHYTAAGRVLSACSALVRCSEAAAATRKRLDEAAEAKEAAEKAANAARDERRKHTAGRLTAEVCTRLHTDSFAAWSWLVHC